MSSTVAELLKEYKALKVFMINKREQEAHAIKDLFPKLINNNKEKERRFQLITHTIHSLDHIERTIIESKYLTHSCNTDREIYIRLGIEKNTYYQYKKQATSKLIKLFSQNELS